MHVRSVTILFQLWWKNLDYALFCSVMLCNILICYSFYAALEGGEGIWPKTNYFYLIYLIALSYFFPKCNHLFLIIRYGPPLPPVYLVLLYLLFCCVILGYDISYYFVRYCDLSCGDKSSYLFTMMMMTSCDRVRKVW